MGRANPGSNICSIYSMAIKNESDAFVEIDLSKAICTGEPAWSNYIRGVLAMFKGSLIF